MQEGNEVHQFQILKWYHQTICILIFPSFPFFRKLPYQAQIDSYTYVGFVQC